MQALALFLALAPSGEPEGWDLDGEGRFGVGTGEVLATRCCPETRRLHWAGIGGRLEASPHASPASRLLLGAQTDLRLGLLEGLGEENDEGALCHATTASLGFDSEWFSIVSGAYLASRPSGRPWRLLPSASLRFGRRASWWIGVDLLDEPSCFLPTCVAGVSWGIVLDDLVVRNGFTLGKDKGRVWVLVPFASGDRWWVAGGELELSEEGAGGFLVAGVRSPWPE